MTYTPEIRELNLKRIITACIICISLAGCTKPQEKLKIEKRPYQKLSPKDVTELVLAKNDPSNNWMIQLVRSSPYGTPNQWKIAALSTDQAIADRQANDIFIEHLLDSLSTLKVVQEAPHGPIAGFGLEPPHYAIRWKTSDQDHEIRIGDPTGLGSGVYFTADQKSVWILEGVTLSLLAQIDSWRYFRKPTLTLETPDDIEEIEIRDDPANPKAKLFYAQRDGSFWADFKHKPVKAPVDDLLTSLMTTPWNELIDDPTQAKVLKKWVQAQPSYQISLRGRSIQPIQIQIRSKDSKLFGIHPNRSEGIFILSQKTHGILTQFFK